jgi:hypothetical protein
VNTDDGDLRTLLRRTAAEVESPAGFLEEVRRAGRRQLARRRILACGGLACVAVVTAGGAFRAGRDEEEPADLATPYFDQPTRGDLSRDRSYLDSVRRAWRASMDGFEADMRGQPHIVWAGMTPAGPAAYVIQRLAYYRADPGERVLAVMSFVRSGPRGPEIVGRYALSETPPHWLEDPRAMLLGADRSVLLVLDRGHPVEYSVEYRYAPDGKVLRSFRPVPFADGAAVLRVPAQSDKVTVALRDGRGDPLAITGTDHILRRDGLPPRRTHTLPGADAVWGGDLPLAVHQFVTGPGALSEYDDPGGTHGNDGSSELALYGATPDGRRLYVTTLQFDDDPARAVALLARGETPFTAVTSGFVDWTDPLPVRLRLSGGQGTVVVAAQGAALSYRSGTAGWRDAGRDAALLPPEATEVRVTPKGGAAAELRL